MKLRSLFLSLIAASAFIATPAFAEGIAFVNMDRILHDSSAGKSVKAQLDAKQKSFQAEVSKKEEEFNKEQEALAQQRAVLSPEAFEKKVKEFGAKTYATKKDVQVKHDTLNNAFTSSLGEIQKSVLDIVGRIAKEKGYSAVLPTSQLLYADPRFDITVEVLNELNSTLPKVTVNFKAAAPSNKDE